MWLGLFILPISDLPTPIRRFLCYQSQGFSQQSFWVHLHLHQLQLGTPFSLLIRAGKWSQILPCYVKCSCRAWSLAAARWSGSKLGSVGSRADLKLHGSTGKLHLAWERCTSLCVPAFTLNPSSPPEQQAANAGSCLPCQPVFFEYLSPMSCGTDGRAARQRPRLGLGVFGPQLWSAQGAGIHRMPRAQAGAGGPLHEPTGPHVYCNPSYKAGILVLPRTVKYCYSCPYNTAQSLLITHKRLGPIIWAFIKLLIFFKTFCSNMQVTMQKGNAPADL